MRSSISVFRAVGFKDAEDVILLTLQFSPAKPSATPQQPDTAHPDKSLREVFEAEGARWMTLISVAARPPEARSTYR
jgi:hypothetical protein